MSGADAAANAPTTADHAARDRAGAARVVTGFDRWAQQFTARLFRSVRSAPSAGLGATIRELDRRSTVALALVRAYYAVGLLWVSMQMGRWVDLRNTASFDPLWPAGWIPGDDPRRGITLVLIAYTGATVLAMCFPKQRLARLAYSVALLQFLSVSMAFGKINHDYHAWWWTSALLVFLPTGGAFRRGGRAVQHRLLATLWAAQVMILFFYTLTGLWKLEHAVRALRSGAVSAFELDGFSLIVAERLLQTNQTTLLGELLVDHPLPGWVLFNGTMYLEATSILIAFRPRLHRVWGIGLLLFHLGTQLAMGFTFFPNVVLLGLLFLASPWAPEEIDVRAMILDLPGIRLISRLAGRLRTARGGAPVEAAAAA